MEKGNYPVVVTPDAEVQAERSKRHVILTSWASVATALLLVVLIGGAFYVADLRGRQCDENPTGVYRAVSKSFKASEKTFEEDGRQTREDFYLDGDSHTELIVKKTTNGNIEAIAEINYKTKIAAVYVPSTDRCLLAAGVQLNWLDEWNAPDENTTIKVDGWEDLRYTVTANKVVDLSIVPDRMIPYCGGKEIFWMQREGDNNLRGGRQKRVKEGGCIIIPGWPKWKRPFRITW